LPNIQKSNRPCRRNAKPDWRDEAAVMRYIEDLRDDEIIAELNKANADPSARDELVARIKARKAKAPSPPKVQPLTPPQTPKRGRGRPPKNRNARGEN
jgi:hypothetical protein